MKTKSVLIATVASGWLTLALSAAAQDSSNNPAPVVLNETFNAKFVLTATPDAPQGAKGTATLNSHNVNGTQTVKLMVNARGLDPGDYTVSAVQASDGSTVPLGDFTVPDTGKGHGKSTKAKIPVTADMNGADVAQIIVSGGSNTVAVLEGDLSSTGSVATLTANVAVTPGADAPGASGKARLKSSVKKGQRKDNFLMTVAGVPPDSTLGVSVDDTDTGTTVTSTHTGHATVKTLPTGLTTISSVSLTDGGGGEVARADF
jgi:hypothetical protein